MRILVDREAMSTAPVISFDLELEPGPLRIVIEKRIVCFIKMVMKMILWHSYK